MAAAGVCVCIQLKVRPKGLISSAVFSFLFFGAAGCLPAPAQQNRSVNRDALVIADFNQRVAQYVKLHKQIAASLPPLKPTASAAQLTYRQRLLANKVRVARSRAKQGDIFTPEISAEFKRLIRMAMHGSDARRIRSNLKETRRPRLRVHVNEPYPESAPLSSTPPTLLLNLPNLPPDLDYHLVGRDLVLRDVGANVVVDIIPAAVP